MKGEEDGRMKDNTKYNAVFISDLHLGSKHCQSDKLLDFLKTVETNNLFLVGDIIDGWRLSKKWYWPKEHSNIIKEILKKDIPVTYITGNHDEFLRSFGKFEVGNVKLVNQCSYTGINSERYLVAHGDMFDYLMRTKFGRRVMYVGDKAYNFLIYINAIVNSYRRWRNKPRWSLSKYLKRKAKAAANFVGNYEDEMIKYCDRKGYEGIICGHIHTPNIKTLDNITYMNTGDWCENCSALVETVEGTWEIIYV